MPFVRWIGPWRCVRQQRCRSPSPSSSPPRPFSDAVLTSPRNITNESGWFFLLCWASFSASSRFILSWTLRTCEGRSCSCPPSTDGPLRWCCWCSGARRPYVHPVVKVSLGPKPPTSWGFFLRLGWSCRASLRLWAWHRHLPMHPELDTVQPPGRTTRFNSPRPTPCPPRSLRFKATSKTT